MSRSEEYKNRLEETRKLLRELDQTHIALHRAEENYKNIIENIVQCKKLLLEGTQSVKIVRREGQRITVEDFKVE